MNFCNITDDNKPHLKTLIKWLFDEVVSAGGDGDGIWYSKYYNAKDIKNLILEEKLLPIGFEITKDNDQSVSFGEGQEWLTITNDEEEFDRRPSWQQVSLIY